VKVTGAISSDSSVGSSSEGSLVEENTGATEDDAPLPGTEDAEQIDTDLVDVLMDAIGDIDQGGLDWFDV